MTVELPLLHTVGVIGAGLMGSGIAQVLAVAGYEVLLNDQRSAAVAKVITEIGARLDRLVEKGSMSLSDASQAKARIRGVNDLSPMAGAQMVIEAVIERLDVKQALFAELEKVVSDTTILATNTSSLSVAAIGRGCRKQDRICGMHFFNPVPLMALVEVIPGPLSADWVIDSARLVVKEIGKVSVLAKDAPGFLVNLGGRAYYTEALHIEAEGVASPAQIDMIMTASAGFKMGPFQLMDLTGIDTNYPVTTYIHSGYQFDPRLKTTPLHQLMVEAGRYGRKVGRGFYDYSVKPEPAPARPGAGPVKAFRAVVPEGGAAFEALVKIGLEAATGDDLPILIAPLGEDATTVAHRLGVDPAKVVAIDLTGLERGIVTLMTPPVASAAVAQVADWLRGAGYQVERVRDSAGFVAQRVLLMIINLACEIAQSGVGSPADIDTAMTLGLGYPKGPLAWGDQLGADNVLRAMERMQAITGSDRYRPSLWLRRRALLGLSLLSSAS